MTSFPDYTRDKPSAYSNAASWPTNIIRLATLGLPIPLLLVVINQPWKDPLVFFLDPLVAAEISENCCSVAYGFMSQLGVMLWITTAAVCLFSATIMLIRGAPRNLLFFAITAGLLTGWLGIDDAFLLHEKVLPKLGVPQIVVLFTYVLLTLAYLASSWRIIMQNDCILLLVGGFAFAFSLAFDIVVHAPSWVYLEDSGKFIGICCWTSFHVSALAKALSR